MTTAVAVLNGVSPVCCVPLSSTATFPVEDAARLAGRLKALADPVRLRLIAYMLSRPNNEACTCDLAPAVGLSEPTISHHLKTLERAGLVSKERRGMNVHYAVDSAAIRALGAAIQLDTPTTIPRATPARKEKAMSTIHIYEPALCCDTGVCGVDVDQALVTITADVRAVQELGADIERHNLASDPTAFTDDETVRAFMHRVGSKGLPLTIVDGVTVAVGSYPTKDDLVGLAGLTTPTVEASAGCCGASGCC
jgi:DNA-binding transcriptional ArsR family regulator